MAQSAAHVLQEYKQDADLYDEYDGVPVPDLTHIITEDDTPVDNIFSEKQQRLLSESLNLSWKPGTPFIAAANVGIFYALHEPPIVPDMFLSLDVQVREDMWKKENRSYFIWEYGKPPEVAVEIVSNRKGGELDHKLKTYERIRVLYYVIFDPQKIIQNEELRVYEFSAKGYIPKIGGNLTQIGLRVQIWEGMYEGVRSRWLRWYDSTGQMILTGAELAEQEFQRAEQERQRAEIEQQKAEQERQRAEMAEHNADQAQKQGMRTQAAETARKMLARGYVPDEICELTGLSAAEISALG
ncbi:MAG: Uma2 family endonuclease [Desulfococcaceae bacterium]